MPTPVGPVAPDPNDPDLWSEWYDDDEPGGDAGPSRYGWAVRLLALLAILAVILVLVL
ncbi:MAG: hypothetical protein QOG43_1622 [Actinomycetota bacterium]|jgi:hypothetical protein|nr:hypothetical protein [Actinomycetota bacterium]